MNGWMCKDLREMGFFSESFPLFPDTTQLSLLYNLDSSTIYWYTYESFFEKKSIHAHIICFLCVSSNLYHCRFISFSTGIYVICDCVWKIRCCRNWLSSFGCPVFQYFKNKSTLIYLVKSGYMWCVNVYPLNMCKSSVFRLMLEHTVFFSVVQHSSVNFSFHFAYYRLYIYTF